MAGPAANPSPLPGDESVPEMPQLGPHEQVRLDQRRVLSESFIVLRDKGTATRQVTAKMLLKLVGRLAVVQGSEDIVTVIERYNVPQNTRGVDAIVVDLDQRVPKLMDYLRSRSLSPTLGKLPLVAVVIVINPEDPRQELLAQVLESGVDGVLCRPLGEANVAACLGEVLRKRANVAGVYKDLMGEVETFRYPYFGLDGLHFQSVSEGGSSALEDENPDFLGESIRIYRFGTSP